MGVTVMWGNVLCPEIAVKLDLGLSVCVFGVCSALTCVTVLCHCLLPVSAKGWSDCGCPQPAVSSIPSYTATSVDPVQGQEPRQSQPPGYDASHDAWGGCFPSC